MFQQSDFSKGIFFFSKRRGKMANAFPDFRIVVYKAQNKIKRSRFRSKVLKYDRKVLATVTKVDLTRRKVGLKLKNDKP